MYINIIHNVATQLVATLKKQLYFPINNSTQCDTNVLEWKVKYDQEVEGIADQLAKDGSISRPRQI